MGWNYLSIPKLQWCNRWSLELISNFIPDFIEHVITYPCWNLSQNVLVKGALVLWSVKWCDLVSLKQCDQKYHQHAIIKISRSHIPIQQRKLIKYLFDRKYKDYVYERCYYRSTWKNKEYSSSKDKAKNDMMYQDIYNCICQNTIFFFILATVWPWPSWEQSSPIQTISFRVNSELVASEWRGVGRFRL